MHYHGPILVTVAYITLYYLFIVNQLLVKTRLAREYKARGEKFDRYFNTDRFMLAADRYVGNTLEHMPQFLILLWLVAVFVSQGEATWVGAVYVVSRAAYPFVMGRQLGKGVPSRIMFATVFGYGVTAWFCVRLLMVVLQGAA